MEFSSLFTQFPVLRTERFVLRRIVPEDAPDFFVMRSDPEVMRYIPRPLAVVVDDVMPVIKMVDDGIRTGERINWAIVPKESDQLIGMIGYVNIKKDHSRAEVGYSLSREWHRKGIMREALQRVLRFGFEEMALHSIEAIIDAENNPSAALLEAAGFRKEAHYIEDFLHKGEYRNSIHYGMLAREFRGA